MHSYCLLVNNIFFSQALEDEEKMTPEQLAIKNVGKQDPKRHLEEKVDVLMTTNIVQCLGAMLDTVVFKWCRDWFSYFLATSAFTKNKNNPHCQVTGNKVCQKYLLRTCSLENQFFFNIQRNTMFQCFGVNNNSHCKRRYANVLVCNWELLVLLLFSNKILKNWLTLFF